MGLLSHPLSDSTGRIFPCILGNYSHNALMITHTEQLKIAIDSYCKKSGLSTSTVGHKVANSGSFYERLSNGSDVTTKTYNRAKQWLEDNGINFDDLAEPKQ